jgi:hypothetical protein
MISKDSLNGESFRAQFAICATICQPGPIQDNNEAVMGFNPAVKVCDKTAFITKMAGGGETFF